MANKLEEYILANGQQIRDTDAAYSNVIECKAFTGYFIQKLLLLKNTHNQALTITIQGSRDFSDDQQIFDLGPSGVASTIALAATTGKDYYPCLTEPWPYIRIKIQASTIPTSGGLWAYLIGEGK